MRIGHGYDVHCLVKGRKLILGGVEIPFESGLLGHSDADVLLHAVCDSLLGAAALGDIGKHFPDTDEKYSGISSRLLLKQTVRLIKEKLNISDDDAYLFHIEMWIYVHGIATMIATQYLDLDEEFISRVITDAYNGLKLHYCSNKK